jgi:hypothetical protein
MGGYQPTPMPYPDAATLPKGSQLLAIASGLLSGPTFGEGLGKGLQNMLGVQQANRQGQMQMNQQAMELNRLGITQNMDMARIHAMMAPKQHGQPVMGTDPSSGKPAMMMPMVDGSGNVTYQVMPGLTAAGQRVTNAADTNLQGNLAAAKALPTASIKDNLKDSEAMATDYKSSGDLMQTIADARQEIQKNPNNIGQAVTSRVNRYLTQELGIPLNGMDPSDPAITQKIVNGLNNSAVLGQAKGTISRLTQGEFQTLKSGYLNMNMSPQSALAMLDTMEAEAKRRMSIGEDWANTAPADKAAVLKDPNGFDTWYMGKLGGQYANRGINSDPSKPTPSQYQSAPNGGVEHKPINSFWK